MKKWTTAKIIKRKGDKPFACITAYDAPMARIFDAAGIALILVGDSVANNVLGFSTTIPAKMDQMVDFTAAVVRGNTNALVVGDMPFMSYQVNDDLAMINAGRFLQEAGADAIKLEGGEFRAPLIKKLVSNGIPVLAHIGLTPQSVFADGGYRMHGKTIDEAEQLRKDAIAVAEAGAFGVVLECVPAALAEEITKLVPIPTIGIGAGSNCDGQILVMHDLLGINAPENTPKFARRYAEVGSIISDAVSKYVDDVENKNF